MVVKAFISYSFDDQEIMNNILKKLQFLGVECYISKHDENYGGLLPEKLTSAIDSSNVVIAILTENGSKSPTVNQEIGYAKNRKRIIPLLAPGISPPVFLQGMEDGRFTPDTMDKVFNKIASYVATKMPLEIKQPTGKNLKEIVEQEGIDSETDGWFDRFILERGRTYVMKKYGRLDVPLNKEIKILIAIGIGFLIPILSVIGYGFLFSHGFDSNLLYLEMGLAFLGAPAGVVFYVVNIIEKRKCKKCNSNFGIEITDSKLVNSEELSRTENQSKIQDTYRNTYTCKFCSNVNIKNERKIRIEYSGSYI